MRFLLVFLFLLSIFSFQFCSPPSVCVPGKTESCPCPGGTSGTQTCKSDGSGFGTCQCGQTQTEKKEEQSQQTEKVDEVKKETAPEKPGFVDSGTDKEPSIEQPVDVNVPDKTSIDTKLNEIEPTKEQVIEKDSNPPETVTDKPIQHLKDCFEILTKSPSSKSGTYTIKPSATEPAFQAYCDMTTNGGGWTLIFKAQKDDYNSKTIDYTITNKTLRQEAKEVLLVYLDGSDLPTGANVSFAMPQKWIDKAPMQYQKESLSLSVKVDDVSVGKKTLQFGYGDFDGTSCSSWTSKTYSVGRIGVCGTSAPYWTHFGLPNYDNCSTSNTSKTDYQKDKCNKHKRFAIFVRAKTISCNYLGKDKGVCKGSKQDNQGACVKPSEYDAKEKCGDKLDNNCDGTVDEGCPCNYLGKTKGVCSTAKIDNTGACGKPSEYDAKEKCGDKLDNNCDGNVDKPCKMEVFASFDLKKTILDARKHCLNLGGDLAWIFNKKENDLVTKVCTATSTSCGCLIGLFKPFTHWLKGSSSWTNGATPVTYKNWSPNKNGSGSYCQIYTKACPYPASYIGGWDDVGWTSSFKTPFVCRFSTNSLTVKDASAVEEIK